MAEKSKMEEIRKTLNRLFPVLVEVYQVEWIALFGSHVRAEQRPDSDLDVLVTFRETPDLFEFIRLEQLLSDTLGISVDLVMKDALKPHIGEQILNETIAICHQQAIDI